MTTKNITINVRPNFYYTPNYPSTGQLSFTLIFWAAENIYYSYIECINNGLIDETPNHENGVFTSIEDAINYYSATKITELCNQMNSNLNLSTWFNFVEGEIVASEAITEPDIYALINSLKGANNGLASLDSEGKIPSTQLPDSASTTDGLTEGTENLYFTPERAQTALEEALSGKQDAITPETEIANPSDVASTDAPEDAPEDLNVVTTLLGTLTGEVNSSNIKQNQTAAIVNEHGRIINDHKDKITLIIAALKSLNLMEDN